MSFGSWFSTLSIFLVPGSYWFTWFGLNPKETVTLTEEAASLTKKAASLTKKAFSITEEADSLTEEVV